MTHGSLFTGIGGIDEGFRRAGIETRWQVEKNPWRRQVLAASFSGVLCYHDATELNPLTLEQVDVVSCDAPLPLRGHYFRILSELLPPFALLLTGCNEDKFESTLSRFRLHGYNADWKPIGARMWILGSRSAIVRFPATSVRDAEVEIPAIPSWPDDTDQRQLLAARGDGVPAEHARYVGELLVTATRRQLCVESF